MTKEQKIQMVKDLRAMSFEEIEEEATRWPPTDSIKEQQEMDQWNGYFEDPIED